MKNIKHLIFGLLSFMIFSSCQKYDDYKKFTKDGPITYPAKAKSIISRPGDNRVALELTMSPDPAVKKVRVSWDLGNGQEFKEFDVTPDKIGNTMEIILTSMKEANYGFVVTTYDDKNHQSIGTSINGVVYGNIYKSGLLARSVNAKNTLNGLSLEFPVNSDTTQYQSKLMYMDATGATQTRLIPPEQTTLTINDMKTNAFSIQTLFKPGVKQNSLDVFSSPVNNIVFNRFAGLYRETGTLVREGNPPDVLGSDVTLERVDENTVSVITGLNIFNNTNIRYRLTLDNNNNVTITSDPVGVANGITIYPIAPAPTYDPVNKVFTLNYEYKNATGLKRTFSAKLELK